MSSQPRVVLVLDPRPGALPAAEIQLADGRSLDAVVGERAVAEAGELVGAVTGAAGVVELLTAESLNEAQNEAQNQSDRPVTAALCLVDGSTLALPT
ncbi:MAG: hypothetical protein M3P23_12930, partial [Actinomycetota bacterium]|nr:hypothetical protein [Actinomycetota bacterium]